MNKLVTLPIVDAFPLMPTDDKAVRLASEVTEAETRARRSGVTRNLLERQKLSKNGYAALCRLDQLAGKLTRSRPSTVAGLVAKANAARLLDGYGEGFTSEIQAELARDVLRLLAPEGAAYVSAELAIHDHSRRISDVVQAVSDYRRALSAEARVRQALSRLVEKHPELEDVRPAVPAGIRGGKPISVRCLADWRMYFGDQYQNEWQKFSRALDEARPAHALARRRSGITKAANAVYEAGRVTARAFERICRLKPRTPRDLKAFTGAIVRHLQRQADGPISNAYPYSDESDYQAWKGRRHTAMFTALRVLNHLAR